MTVPPTGPEELENALEREEAEEREEADETEAFDKAEEVEEAEETEECAALTELKELEEPALLSEALEEATAVTEDTALPTDERAAALLDETTWPNAESGDPKLEAATMAVMTDIATTEEGRSDFCIVQERRKDENKMVSPGLTLLRSSSY